MTGNPVREAIARLNNRRAPRENLSQPTLLILGGSQGAESLNEAVADMLARQLPALAGWRIVHQTGASQHECVSQKYAGFRLTSIVEPFFDNLAEWYACATLVISRAGATTLAELACGGCPVILLPYPHAADNHQLANAKVYESAGAAMIVEHDRIQSQTVDRLSTAVAVLAQDASRRNAMRHAMRQFARPDAAGDVRQVLQSVMAGLKNEY